MDINTIIENRGRIYYWHFLNKVESTQYHLGTNINDITQYNQSDKNRYNESVRVYLKYKHLINDETQTNITQNMLGCLLESIYIIKFNIFKIEINDELELLRNKKITKRCLKTEKAKINKKLNKIIPKLRTNMIARQKKQFLINIQSANLPHDLENLIFTYIY